MALSPAVWSGLSLEHVVSIWHRVGNSAVQGCDTESWTKSLCSLFLQKYFDAINFEGTLAFAHISIADICIASHFPQFQFQMLPKVIPFLWNLYWVVADVTRSKLNLLISVVNNNTECKIVHLWIFSGVYHCIAANSEGRVEAQASRYGSLIITTTTIYTITITCSPHSQSL